MRHIVFILLITAATWTVSAQGGQLDPSFGTNGLVKFDIGMTRTQGYDLVTQSDGKLLALGALDALEQQIVLTRMLPDGALDPTFGNGGKTTYQHSNPGNPVNNAYGNALALQPDGKILVAGSVYAASSDFDVLLLRYLPNGAPDASFGTGGKVVGNLGTPVDAAYALALQADGKILVAGSMSVQQSKLFIKRYLPNGQPDPTFNEGLGMYTLDIDPNKDDGAYDLFVQPDGKILAAGYAGNGQILLVRLSAAGVVDPTFGAAGVATINIPGHTAYANAAALLPDGKIAVAGASRLATSAAHFADFFVARLSANGQLDAGFDGDGWTTLGEGNIGEMARSLCLDASGNIIAAGGLGGRFAAARFTANGALDATFGQEGVQVVALPDLDPDYAEGGAHALLRRPDGKFVLAGTALRNQTLVRLTGSGDLDPAFGSAGIVHTEFYGLSSSEKAYAAVRQPDGKLLLAGSVGATEFDSDTEFTLARFQADGSPDPGFGNGGRVVTVWGRGHDQARALALQTDGKIVTAGFATLDGAQRFALARYLPDGRLDPAFGALGLVYTNLTADDTDCRANTVALQPDGKIIAAGYAKNGIAIARYLPNGALDQAFGSGGKVIIPFPLPIHEAFALALQPDGKLLLAGGTGDVALLRLHPDGALDLSFGAGGKVLVDMGGNIHECAYALALMPDGRIVLGGSAGVSGDYFVARYLPNGSPDLGFNGSGGLVADFGSYSTVYALNVQADGKILAAGAANGAFALARYLPNGQLDPEFGINGRTFAAFGANSATLRAMLLQPDHEIVLAGSAYASEENGDFALARVQAGVVTAVSRPEGPIEGVQLYANPAADAALLNFQLRGAEELSVEIYNINGQLLERPVSGAHYPAGEYRLHLNTARLSPGHYIVVLNGEQGQASVRLVKAW